MQQLWPLSSPLSSFSGWSGRACCVMQSHGYSMISTHISIKPSQFLNSPFTLFISPGDYSYLLQSFHTFNSSFTLAIYSSYYSLYSSSVPPSVNVLLDPGWDVYWQDRRPVLPLFNKISVNAPKQEVLRPHHKVIQRGFKCRRAQQCPFCTYDKFYLVIVPVSKSHGKHCRNFRGDPPAWLAFNGEFTT